MIPGLNHNIRYRDRVFHVQTEDSGLIRRQLTTHVFLDGSVVAYERTTYPEAIAALADEALRNNEIRKLMQNQHRALLKKLVGGSFDEALVRLGVIPRAELPASPEAEKEVREILASLPPEPRTAPNPPARPSLPPNLPSPPPLEPRRSDSLRKQSELRRPVPADMAPTADVVRDPRRGPSAPVAPPAPHGAPPPLPPQATQPRPPKPSDRPASEARARASDPRFNPERTLIDEPLIDRPAPRTSREWPREPPPRAPSERGQRPTTSDPALRNPKVVPGAPRPGVFTDRPQPSIPPHAAQAYNRTLIDVPPIVPPEIAASVRRASVEPPDPRLPPRPPRGASGPPRPASIHDERTLVEPKKPQPPRPADLEHDTLLDFQSPFVNRSGPDPMERRTDPPSGSRPRPPSIARSMDPLPQQPPRASLPRSGGAGKPPLDPSSAVTLRDMPTNIARGQSKQPTPLPLLEDPTMDEGLIGLQTNDDQVLDVLDPNEVISGLDEHSEETDPLRNAPSWRQQNLPPRSASERLAPYPTPSTPPLAGASWLDAADLTAGAMPQPQSARGEPGRRPWAQNEPGAPPASFSPGTTPTPPTSESPIWTRTPDLATLEPQPVWPPPDADLDQFVREQAQLIPEPPAPHEPIRVEDRSLDDIILGYLSHKKG